MDLPAPNVTAGARGSDIEQDCVKSTTVIIIAFIEFLFLIVVFVLIYRFYLKDNSNSSSSRGNSVTEVCVQGCNGSCKGQLKQDQHTHLVQQNGNGISDNSFKEEPFHSLHQENSSYLNQTDTEENFQMSRGHEDPIRFSSDQINSSMDSKVTAV